MVNGIRQKRYQMFTKNGIVWSEWFNWSGTEEKWQLKGKLLNEYRTIFPPGCSSPDEEGNSKATANGTASQQPSIFPEGSLNNYSKRKQLTPSRKGRSPRRKESSSLKERNKRNWMMLYPSEAMLNYTEQKEKGRKGELSLFP
jgi:hypothetical protein